MPKQYTFQGHTFTVPDNATMEQVQDYVQSQGWMNQPSSAPVDTRNSLQRNFDEASQIKPLDFSSVSNAVDTTLGNTGAGLLSLATPLVHPLKTLEGINAYLNPFSKENPYADVISDPREAMRPRPLIGPESRGEQVRELGGLLFAAPGMAAGGELMRPVASLLPKAAGAIREAAIGDPDVAAIRAAGVPRKGILGFKADVQGARPYLQGAKSVEDVQNIAGLGGTARGEIYKPIDDFLLEHGDRVVQGPDGPATLNDLEAERGQVSAQLRQLRSGGPEGIVLATQKGLTQADLLARQDALQNAIDPHLMGAGIDSPLIRKTYGQVARVGDRFAGRWTPAEKPTPYGFGRLTNVDVFKPRTWLGQPVQGVRDLLAGRPLWSGNAGDVGVREAFRFGGPKPDFRAPISAMPPWKNAPKLLEANVPGNAPFGEEPYAGSMNGIPERFPVRVPNAPKIPRGLLTSSASEGEVQPMFRFARPYVEPFDPHFSPVDLEEYLKFRPKAK